MCLYIDLLFVLDGGLINVFSFQEFGAVKCLFEMFNNGNFSVMAMTLQEKVKTTAVKSSVVQIAVDRRSFGLSSSLDN